MNLSESDLKHIGEITLTLMISQGNMGEQSLKEHGKIKEEVYQDNIRKIMTWSGLQHTEIAEVINRHPHEVYKQAYLQALDTILGSN